MWVVVDPSWDRGLSKAGFRISEWNGLTPTVIGVDPLRTYTVEESKKLIEEEEEINPEIRANYLAENKEFFDALNLWMEEQRKK
ncbi:MAG: hypothetical protein AAB449_01680 [Patescibacteria group bacterium]